MVLTVALASRGVFGGRNNKAREFLSKKPERVRLIFGVDEVYIHRQGRDEAREEARKSRAGARREILVRDGHWMRDESAWEKRASWK